MILAAAARCEIQSSHGISTSKVSVRNHVDAARTEERFLFRSGASRGSAGYLRKLDPILSGQCMHEDGGAFARLHHSL